MRTLSKEKVPRPNFNYELFKSWLAKPYNKFVVEIGCGVGFHPILWAKNNSSSKILAIERTSDKFKKFLNRFNNHKDLTNIFPAHADAAALLPHLEIADIVDEYYILYPNPYPKKKHSNLRFSQSPLTGYIIDKLKSGGHLHFATNIESYADELRREIPKYKGIKIIKDHILNINSNPLTNPQN